MHYILDPVVVQAFIDPDVLARAGVLCLEGSEGRPIKQVDDGCGTAGKEQGY